MTCGAQKLTCKFDISRLDFGGLTIKSMEIRGADPTKLPLRAEKIAVDLVWDSLFSPRAKAVAAEGVTIRLDLRDGKPLLGELDGLLKPYMKPDDKKKPGPLPQLNLVTIKVIIETAAGPVEANGKMTALSANDFTLDVAVAPSHVGYQGAVLDLKAGSLKAQGKAGAMSGELKVDVARFKSDGASIEAAKADVSFSQANNVMTATGDASATEMVMAEGGVRRANVKFAFESEPLNLNLIGVEHILTRLRKAALNGAAEEGEYAGATWKSGLVAAVINPSPGGGAAGEIKATVQSVRHSLGTAERVDVAGKIKVDRGDAQGKGRFLVADGTAMMRGGALADGPTRNVAGFLVGMVASALPEHAAMLDKATKDASGKFSLDLPWTFRIDDKEVQAAALPGITLQASSGFSAKLTGAPEAKTVFAFAQGDKVKWTGGGLLKLQGGGAPSIDIRATASGEGSHIKASGDVDIRPWTVKGTTVAMRLNGLDFVADEAGGKAAGDMSLTFAGKVIGAEFKGGSARGAVKAAWAKNTMTVDAPAGLQVGWSEAKFDETALGAASLRYVPSGHFAEKRGDTIVGAGRIEGVTFPVKGANFTGQGKLGATAINWTQGKALDVRFDLDPSSFALIEAGKEGMSVTLGDVKGSAHLAGGWKLKGEFGSGLATTDMAVARDIKGAFDIAGGEGGMSGKVSDISLRMHDARGPEEKLFEDLLFDGKVDLSRDLVTFGGQFTLASNGVSLGNVAGTHSLAKDGRGQAKFTPAPLIFKVGSFQPSELSPVLRGPANVGGRVSVAGAATWGGGKDFATTADLELADLGFSIAGAGVFERVSGKVHVDDVLKLTTSPNQKINVGKVTLGAPIENGVVTFQMLGADTIKVRARWPFVGGELLVREMNFSLKTDAVNNIVAEAKDWDLNKLVALFEVKDLKLEGVVNGTFPVTFSTGSAKINNAKLAASDKGGVVKYTGGEGDAAGNADPSAKMVFDALKDFRFEVMSVTLDGDITGRIVIGAALKGYSPAQNNSWFAFNLSLDSELMRLLNTPNAAAGDIDRIVTGVVAGKN